jgi:hypothetical protein
MRWFNTHFFLKYQSQKGKNKQELVFRKHQTLDVWHQGKKIKTFRFKNRDFPIVVLRKPR